MHSETYLFEAIDATWPPYEIIRRNGWLLREGRGGGQRVSAATQLDESADTAFAVRHMRSLGQTPLFMIRGSDQALDQGLAQDGFAIVDPVVLLGQPLTQSDTEVSEFHSHHYPTANQVAIWEAGGVGPARIDVMKRTQGRHCFAALNIAGETVATAFVGIHNDIAMAHAVEVPRAHRRCGFGLRIMHGIQCWAATNGAKHLVVLTVRENVAARTLYENMGMIEVGAYHYRKDLSAP